MTARSSTPIRKNKRAETFSRFHFAAGYGNWHFQIKEKPGRTFVVRPGFVEPCQPAIFSQK